MESLLRIEGLTKTFQRYVRGRAAKVPALSGVSFDLRQGECFGLVGESGSGKTTLGRCIVRLVQPDSGRIIYRNTDILTLSERKFRRLRPKLQIIFQNPAQALNPRQSVGACLAEPLRVHRICPKTEVQDRVQELLAAVELDATLAHRYPHQLSGGQRQRVAIARALALQPEVLVADEATSSLDAPVKLQVLELLNGLRERLGLTVLLISHDLGMVAHAADRIGVLYSGELVEVAPTRRLLRAPVHPYSARLVALAAHRLTPVDGSGSIISARVNHPATLDEAAGCRFAFRCSLAESECWSRKPTLTPIAPGHRVACHRWQVLQEKQGTLSVKRETAHQPCYGTF